MKRSCIKVVVIDLQSYWREYTAGILRRAGYQLLTLTSYEEALQLANSRASWDCILLGCASIAQEERRLVAHLISRQQSVIVLATSLSLQDMRGLFLQGTIDVADKTYHPAEILAIVKRVQERLIKRNSPWIQAKRGVFV